jgi:hypothetical protein
MALSASEVYYLNADELRQACEGRGLETSGPVKALRERLAVFVRGRKMDEPGEVKAAQAGAQTDVVDNVSQTDMQNFSCCSHEGKHGLIGVLVELLRKLAPLSSEKPEQVLCFFVRLVGVYKLGLVADRVFIMRILPLTSGSVLEFLGRCLAETCSWVECRKRLLKRYFPCFVRERLIRDLIVFHLHDGKKPVREYVEQIFGTAKFLEYSASEPELVDRIVMNLHPTILAHAAFVDRPHSREQLYNVIEIMKERSSVTAERKRQEGIGGVSRGEEKVTRQTDSTTPRRVEPSRAVTPKCWACGRLGHVRRDCRQKTASENGSPRRRSAGPRAKILGGFKRVRKSARELPLWMMADFRVGKVPTLVDTGAQFSCIREDVMEYFRREGYPGKVSPCRMTCVIADGNSSTVTEAVKLGEKLLSFSWLHECKISKGDHSQEFWGWIFYVAQVCR